MVGDSSWEIYTANLLENSPHVRAYAKNDHLGFQLHYLWNGSKRRFIPDFLVRFMNGINLVLEIKGEDSEQHRAKRQSLAAWIEAVNTTGSFGVWAADVAFEPARVHDIIAKWSALPNFV